MNREKEYRIRRKIEEVEDRQMFLERTARETEDLHQWCEELTGRRNYLYREAVSRFVSDAYVQDVFQRIEEINYERKKKKKRFLSEMSEIKRAENQKLYEAIERCYTELKNIQTDEERND